MAIKPEVFIKDYDKIKTAMEKIETAAEKATANTVKDMKSRGPGLIATEVVKTYNIKKSEITPANTTSKKTVKKAGSVSVRGDTIEALQFVYKGRRLTLTHFSMKPNRLQKTRVPDYSKAPGAGFQVKVSGGLALQGGSPVVQMHQPKPYQITVEIYKGKRKSVSGKYSAAPFLASNGYGGVIPFQRTGKTDSRTDMESMRTLGVPQMVQNEEVDERIHDSLNKTLESRLEHNMKRQGL